MSRWVQLIEHAKSQTKQAARALALTKEKIAGVDIQRQQMEQYRQEYAERASAPGTVVPIRQLNLIRHFGDNVQLTVAELDNQLLALRNHYEVLRGEWHVCYKRERALEALQEIDDAKIAAQEERVRRREEDDFALQTRRRRM